MPYGSYDRYARGGDNPWRLDPGPLPTLDMPKGSLPKTAPLPPKRPQDPIDLTQQVGPADLGGGLGGSLGSGADDWGAPGAAVAPVTPPPRPPSVTAPTGSAPVPPVPVLPPLTQPSIARAVGANPQTWAGKTARPSFLDFITGGLRGR